MFKPRYAVTFFFFILFQIHLFADSDIYLSTINKAILYNNFYDSELFPFMYSTKYLELNKNTVLKLIDEIHYDNELFGDILKVEVLQGNYKGLTGYILERDVSLARSFMKNKNIEIFFKNDVYLKEKNIFIKSNTICTVEDSRLVLNDEILTLTFLSPL